MDKKQQILQEIRRIAGEITPEKLTQRGFRNASSISLNKVRYHFGSFSSALLAAGLTPNPSAVHVAPPVVLADDELLAEIGRMWVRLKRRPSEAAFNSESQYSVRPYYRRWGTFNRAIDEYVARCGDPHQGGHYPGEHQQHEPAQSGSPAEQVAQAVVIPKIHKPRASTRRERILYGEPIEFRGLRYAPINEQGVVYLFGMVSRELEFLIESVRTDFPDCEGKRSTNTKRTEWEHVRIEFEHRSRNFLDHGHDPDECDLIVCWVHDWEDCPLEVLELRSTLPLLPKGS